MSVYNILIVSYYYEENSTSRPYHIYKSILKRGYNATVITSNHSHSNKKPRMLHNTRYYYINTINYSHNKSLRRVFSHILFALRVGKYIHHSKTKYVYISVPPYITPFAISIMYPQLHYISDVIDLWPDSFPINVKIKKILYVIFYPLRKSILKRSKHILFESKYFSEKMHINEYPNKKHYSIILLKKETTINSSLNKSEIISISYVGNIGHVYDLESFILIAYKISLKKPVRVEIIGDGDRRTWLLEELAKRKIKYAYWGYIYDEVKKHEILAKSWYGFNGYKNSTEVALSYKSIDYLSCGVPLINSTKGDTYEFIEKYAVGYNYTPDSIDQIVDLILHTTPNDYMAMSKSARELYNYKFNYNTLHHELDQAMKDMFDI